MRILFLDLDTLRPDHLGCYGYHRNTSPNIDSIADEGIVFDNYYTPNAPCLPSRAALVSGKFGILNGAVNHGGSTADMDKQGPDRDFRSEIGTQSLFCMLREAGFRTASISPFAERHSAFWFCSGLNEMYNTGKGGMESAEDVTPVVMDWLDRNAEGDNWFLHINYWDPHGPYRAPDDFGNPFKDEPLPAWITENVIELQKNKTGPHSMQDIHMYDADPWPDYPKYPGSIGDMEGARIMMDGYDCGIKYMDGHIGKIINHLKDIGVWDDTAVIVTSDHGENMGELGIWGEHATADAITPKIPMIIKWPGKMKNTRDNGLHYNLDLGPTMAEILGTRKMPSWQGQSYASVLESGTEAGRKELILEQCAHVCQRSVRFDEWLYIRTYHDGYHLFPMEMLFNVEKDPYEQNDVAGENPELCVAASHRLQNWHDEMMSLRRDALDPLWETMKEGGPFHARGHMKKYLERLKETGRTSGIEELIRRHPEEMK
ncbi:MAG: sulfatase [Clostridia bacterium]|nr:sulfatase [Clostridia bacterium]MBN2882193.1 sulfatase [Clostridia bacterium]